jgi:undecaprenyl pyrophosphate phosphatase UppP
VAASSGYIFINNPSMSSFPWLALVSSFIFGIISLKVILDFSKKTNFSTLTLVFGLLCLAGGLIEFLIL